MSFDFTALFAFLVELFNAFKSLAEKLGFDINLGETTTAPAEETTVA